MPFMTSERGDASESLLKRGTSKRSSDLHGELIDRGETRIVVSEAPVE